MRTHFFFFGGEVRGLTCCSCMQLSRNPNDLADMVRRSVVEWGVAPPSYIKGQATTGAQFACFAGTQFTCFTRVK
jgi:hypothetical protein